MINFTRTNNIVQIVTDDYEINTSSETTVTGKSGDEWVFVYLETKFSNDGRFLRMRVTDINGRPDDDAANVAEWLKATYFYGPDYGTIATGWPADYANSGNQTAQITELEDIEAAVVLGNTELLNIKNKMASAFVTEPFDEQEFFYVSSGPALGEVDYIIYKLSSSEVARLTFGYNGSTGELEDIIKT